MTDFKSEHYSRLEDMGMDPDRDDLSVDLVMDMHTAYTSGEPVALSMSHEELATALDCDPDDNDTAAMQRAYDAWFYAAYVAGGALENRSW